MELSLKIKESLINCTSCKRCKRICPFLDTYGTPEEIITEKPEKVFLCSNCKACDTVCKENLHPSDVLFEMKSQLLRSGTYSGEVKNALNSANGYAMRGHKFPFSSYPSTDTVFWPGCGLAGTSPEVVKKTLNLLSKHLNKKVGLVLDCCFDPLYQLGDVDSAEKATKKIQERLNRHKVMHVITGCTNCTKVLSHYLQETKVEHILEVLPENFINPSLINNPSTPPFISPLTKGRYRGGKGDGGGLFLHHPCPSFGLDGIRKRAKAHVRSLLNGSQSIKDNENTDPADNGIKESLRPSCCGHGGGINALSHDLSEKFTEKVIKASNGNPIVTYCMGCKGKFLQKGQRAFHLLELITGVKPIEKPVTSTKKWINRFFLSMNQRLNTRKFFFGLMVVFLILLTTYLRKSGYISTDSILEFIQKNNVAAPLVFILIYAIGPSLFIPSLPLTLGAGFLWGPFWGVIFSITGATTGASVAFLVSRYLMGNTIKERFGYERWEWLKEKVDKHGWKAVAFARLLPILPFPVLNYLFGVTPIPFLHYLWSTFVFMLPACIAYVAFGSSMGALILKGNIKGLIIGIIVASIAMLLPFALKPLVKKVSSPKDNG
ncbi:MAG: VTT domain-containing protein [Nitrospirota bacterium]